MAQPGVDLPSIRKRAGAALRSLGPMLHAMLRAQVLLPGTVYELKTRCGKPTCACTRGQLHRRWVFSYSRQGRKKLRVVPMQELDRWRRWARNYRDFRRRRAEFVKRTRAILEELDAIERAQTRLPEE
jgi:hypothetical protein